MNPESIYIFTDGSSRGNPGPGGWGAVVIFQEKNNGKQKTGFKIQELGGREEHTTNNRMELTAAMNALHKIQDSREKIQVFTDSGYLIGGITKWIHGWQKKGWKTADKKPVLNRDLWEKLLELTDNKKIDWKHVNSHVGVAGNERCDEIATAFADNYTPKLYSGVLQNYGIKDILNVTRG
jgi:ribonuclease HI